jgi:predicted phage-related endonuclease
MIATPDRWILRDGTPYALLEIKDVGKHAASKWDNGPPDYVVAQVQWQLYVCDLDTCKVAASICATSPVVFTVEADKAVQQDLKRIGKEFWDNHVAKRIPPPVDASVECTEYLAMRFANCSEEMITDEAAAQIALEYKKADVEMREAEARKVLAGNRLREMVGSNAGVRFQGGYATWARNKAGGTDWRSLAMSFNPTEQDVSKHTRKGSRILHVTLKESK